MSARLDYLTLAPKAARALSQFSHAAGGPLGRRLRDLILLRISQLNGCAFCIDMHWADLLKHGVDARQVNAVAGWREAHRFFDDKDRAALDWAEALNAAPPRAPTDAQFEALRKHFSDEEIAAVSFSVAAIRAWNLMNAGFQVQVPEVPYEAE